MLGLTNRLGVLASIEFVLGVLPQNARLSLWRPCRDILILTEEVDELAFLFVAEAGAHNNVLVVARVSRVERDLLGVLGQLE